eukprot:3606089-Alexandrium_andersonii.AAC.1
MKHKYPDGTFLTIGGGIATTCTSLLKAFQEYADDIKEHKLKITIRRAGPNYIEGLRKAKAASDQQGLDI